MRWTGRAGCGLLFAALAAASLAQPLRAQGTEVVRGKVVDDKGKALSQVDVVITGRKLGAIQRTRTNPSGEFTALFPDPEGSYAVSFRHLGFAEANRVIERVGFADVLQMPNTAMIATPVTLPSLIANAGRIVAVPGDRASVGGTERNLLTDALFSLDAANLAALAMLVPGVFSAGDSGFSVMGASPFQNSTTVDGASFGGASLPRDAIGAERLVTNTFDPSRGDFAGAQVVVTTKRGTDYLTTTFHTQLADSRFAWTDPAWSSGVPRQFSGGGSIGGPIKARKAEFLLGVDVNDAATATPSLFAPDGTLLSQYGVSLDTVGALTRSLGALGVPLTAAQAPTDPATTRSVGSLRLDWRPSSVVSLEFLSLANWTSSRASGISALALPTTSSESHNTNSSFLIASTAYVSGFLDEVHVSRQTSSSSGDGYLPLPGGTVLVGTQFDDGRTGLTSLRFGGSSAPLTDFNTTQWEVRHDLSWVSTNGRHQLKASQQYRNDSRDGTSTANPYGTYSYQSLTDLLLNHPASYTRVFSSLDQPSRGSRLSLSLGDTWRAIPGVLDFQGGARWDGTTFGTLPAYNPAVDAAFGERTDRVPHDNGVSPRLGFSWTPHGRPTPLGPGQALMVAGPGGGAGAVGARGGRGAGGGVAAGGIIPPNVGPLTLSGGVGALHGVIVPGQVAALAGATGLPGSTRVLSCVGDATPIPDWTTPGTASPDHCLDGSTPAFGNNVPSVTVFDTGYRAPVSWRGVLQLTGWRPGNWSIVPTLNYSVGKHVESVIDDNEQRTAQFTLANEANRPVYAAASGIVPATGTFGPGSSRINSGFGNVNRIASDLENHAAEFDVTIVPPKALWGKIPIGFIYSFNAQTYQQRGFFGTTAGDPFAVETVNSANPVHQFRVLVSNLRISWVTLAAQLNVYSGSAYTPVVGNDINGDGRANDRAFIPNPATTTDTALRSQFATLLAAAPGTARNCLQAQLGAIAGAGSCRGPWEARLDLNMGIQGPAKGGAPARLRLSATVLNAGAGLVRLLGLGDTPLGRGTVGSSIDSRLLTVTGFNPATNQFQYKVNQGFGVAYGVGNGKTPFPPVQLAVGLEYRFGGPPLFVAASISKTLGILPIKKGALMPIEQVRSILAGYTADAMAPILEQQDSLKLTAEQAKQMTFIHLRYFARADSIIAPVAEYIVNQKTGLTEIDLDPRLLRMFSDIRTQMIAALNQIQSLLTPEQRLMLVRRP